MTSVAESHAAQEEEDDSRSEIMKTASKPLGLSTFKATQNGLSQASLQFGKSIHNSCFKQVHGSSI